MGEILMNRLGGKPVIWKNEIYDQLYEYHRKFAVSGAELEGSLVDSKGDILRSTPQNHLILPGTVLDKFQGLEYMENEVIARGGEPVIEDGNPWSFQIVVDPNNARTSTEIMKELSSGKLSAWNTRFLKNLSCKQAVDFLKAMESVHADIYSALFQSSCPEGIFLADKTYERCGAGWKIRIIPPTLKLKVLLLQNISEKPIRIRQLRLEGYDASHNLREGARMVAKNYDVSDGTLLAEERLLVPLQLFLSMDTKPGVRDELQRPLRLPKDAVLKTLKGNKNLSIRIDPEFVIGDADTVLEATASDLEVKRLSGPELGRYVEGSDSVGAVIPVGKYFTPKSVVVDNVRTPIHALSAGGVLISATMDAGSCPYLVAYEEDGNSYISGNVLTGRTSEQREGYFNKWIASWPTRVSLVELEDEVTYLRDVQFVCTREDGSEIVVRPQEWNGAEQKVLNKGERVDFTTPEGVLPLICLDRYIRFKGYYVPTAPMTAKAE